MAFLGAVKTKIISHDPRRIRRLTTRCKPLYRGDKGAYRSFRLDEILFIFNAI